MLTILESKWRLVVHRFTVVPMIPTPGVHTLVWHISLSLLVSKNCDLLLDNNIWQRWQDIHDYLIKFSLFPLLALKKQVNMLGNPIKQGSNMASMGWRWLPADSQQETEDLNLTDAKTWITPIMWVILEVILPQSSLWWDHSPGWPLVQSCETLRTGSS